MSTDIQIAIAQVNLVVGDIEGNVERVLDESRTAMRQGADIILFPELTLTSYPPEDLLLRPSLDLRIEAALARLLSEQLDIHMVIGYPKRIDGKLYNMAGVIHKGQLVSEYRKQCLPNYQVFDEKRYFAPGDQPCVFTLKGSQFGVIICEDMWTPAPAEQSKIAGAQCLLVLNASPFHIDKSEDRLAAASKRVQDTGLPLIYANLIGGQDELIFDGSSFVVDAAGTICSQAPSFQEALHFQTLKIDTHNGSVIPDQGDMQSPQDQLAIIYQALVLGVRDYVNKNGFPGVILGLSGGIDSALTLAIAHDALGKDRVEAVMMPFKYTSSMSLEDAEAEANALGVHYRVLSIEPMFNAFMETLSPEFENAPKDTTEENLQARCRGVLLMALSNKQGHLVLTTGNKSEMAVGYATLYGDMVGGYSALKDLYKTLVFDLARYRNQLSPVIPERVITRPPSAELAPDQQDSDSLPDYSVLDAILELYIEGDQSAEAIVAAGFEKEDVYSVLKKVDRNEYKRRQAPIGVRLTKRGFGRDRRYPVTSKWGVGL